MSRSRTRQPALAPRSVDLGKTDETIRRGTGKGWDEWFALLDRWGATQRTHTEIARHLSEQHDVPGWWAQTVSIGYERGRGMRQVHEQAGGLTAGVSKTVALGVEQLFAEFGDARKRSRWLPRGTLRPRTLQPAKSARFDFRGGESRVHVYFIAKGPSKASVHVQHERLADARAVAEARAFWKQSLAKLADRAASRSFRSG